MIHRVFICISNEWREREKSFDKTKIILFNREREKNNEQYSWINEWTKHSSQ
jgi:hypothetical protein